MRLERTKELGVELKKETVVNAYARWAPVYDIVFGAVFDSGRREAIAACERVGGRVLEAGVGTGISLSEYSKDLKIFGIDLSAPMLRKAQSKVDELALTNVEGLAVMDASRTTFPDASFDVVVAQHVVSTVPDPEAVLDEFVRVLKPGGEIVLITRIGAVSGPRRSFETWFMPISMRLGWRSDFPWSRLARWAERWPDVVVLDRRPVPPFGHFWLVRFGKLAAEEASAYRIARAG